MKKLSILFAALLATTLSFAAEKTITLDFTSNTWKLPEETGTSKDSTFTDSKTGYSVTFKNADAYYYNSQNKAVLLGKKKDATITVNSLSKQITKVSIEGCSGGTAKVNWDFLVGTNKIKSFTGCKDTYNIDIPANQQALDNTFVIKITNAQNIQLCKLNFTYEEATSEPTITANDVEFGTLILGKATTTQEINVKGENLTEAIVAALQEGTKFSVTGTLTTEGGALTIGVTATEAGAYKDTLILTAGSLVKKVEITANLVKIIGEGTEEKPYTIADVIALNNTQSTAAWIEGYIVGCVNYRTNKLDTIINTMVALADTKDITEETAFVPVALPAGKIRDAVNLKDNEGNLGLKLTIKGDLVAYFKMPGLKNPTDYKLEEKSLTPATWYSQESISGTLEGKDVKYAITYEITRNADKTLTIKMNLNDEAAAVVGMVPQIFIAGAYAGNFNNGEFTTSATYTDGDVLEMYFYMAYAGGATASAHFNYTVGSSNTPATAIDATVVAPKATKRLINGVLVIEKDGVLYTAQGNTMHN